MKLLKSFTLKWWQGGLLKISMLAAGIAIGAYWYETFSRCIVLLVIIAVVLGAYVSYVVWWKQARDGV